MNRNPASWMLVGEVESLPAGFTAAAYWFGTTQQLSVASCWACLLPVPCPMFDAASSAPTGVWE